MADPVWVSRSQLHNCLRQHGWTHKRQAHYADIWKLRGSTQRINVPRTKSIPEARVRIVLGQAGLSAEQIEDFLTKSVKDDMN